MRSCNKDPFWLSLFSFAFGSSLRSRAVMVFLRVGGAIPSLFVHSKHMKSHKCTVFFSEIS